MMLLNTLAGFAIGLIFVLAFLMILTLIFCAATALMWMLEDLVAPAFDNWGDRK